MKKVLILIIGILGISSTITFAGNEQYLQAMKSAVSDLDSAKTPQEFQQLANTFERIAGVETKEWLPDYYAAYCYTMVVFTEKNKNMIDELMDRAEGLINNADSLKPENSEIYTIKGLVYSGRIMADPASRGRKYGPLAGQMYEKAKQLDETNPRPWFLQGQGLMYTPKMFGGGKDKAKPILETAVAKYKVFKPESDISPNWGGYMAEMMLKKCEN